MKVDACEQDRNAWRDLADEVDMDRPVDPVIYRMLHEDPSIILRKIEVKTGGIL